jgi:hypothetical protein
MVLIFLRIPFTSESANEVGDSNILKKDCHGK